jgi:hypothetical protein
MEKKQKNSTGNEKKKMIFNIKNVEIAIEMLNAPCVFSSSFLKPSAASRSCKEITQRGGRGAW